MRRYFCTFLLLLAATMAAPSVRAAESPILLVVGFSAGGPTDIIARVIGARMGELLGAPVIVENRVGASGNIASEAVARSTPNGRTLLLAPLVFAVNETLFPDRRFEYSKDFAAVAPLAETSNVLVVHSTVPAKTVSDLIAWGKANGDLMYATAGRGTVTHLAGELFGEYTGVRMVPVHYKGGGDLLNDILSGQVKVTFSTIPPVEGFIAQGALRALATTGLERDKILPNLPTLDESGLKDYDMRLWLGLLAPKATPADFVDKLAKVANEALTDRKVLATFDAQGFAPLHGSPAEFDTFMKAEIRKWGAVARKIGVTE
jgi:tripartite-type tricarboxylate transporter receptor subunit TctC